MKQLLISVLFADSFPVVHVGAAESEFPNVPTYLYILVFKWNEYEISKLFSVLVRMGVDLIFSKTGKIVRSIHECVWVWEAGEA